MAKKSITRSIRLPEKLSNAITKTAAKENRTFNNLVVLILTQDSKVKGQMK